ncbi:unnamed protein product [Arabis nemorensis]|uniref:ATPase AAA-type core domain-containing protein n=1 Tax=Arabis nemorensis TaxID=586526 RepID=A0A565B0C3_9BRAS|nr:unnamed protein product [Arabis nemorensis]
MVKDNSELKKLLLDTTGKSIIVIEDIDCSIAFTRQGDNEADKEKNEDEQHSQVTLSGLLNVTDGLWSASSDEKIMVFTTNFVDKLDPAEE